MTEDWTQITSKATVILDKPPCCLQFMPDYSAYFVVGTYNLIQGQHVANDDEEDSTTRIDARRDGSLTLFKLTDDNDFIQIDHIALSYGVLDLHFHDTYLGLATSTGSFALFYIAQVATTATWKLHPHATFQIYSPDTIITSFAWDIKSGNLNLKISTTLTTGAVDIVSLQPSTDTGPRHSSNSVYDHSLEAWITAFAPENWSSHTQYMFSGGDDAVLSCMTRDTKDTNADFGAAWTSRRLHHAGVTALLPLSLPTTSPASANQQAQPNLLLTGSYDDTLRVFRIHTTPGSVPTAPKAALHELNLGGGVWRIKLLDQETKDTHPKSTDHEHVATEHRITLVVCAMYAGAFVVQLRVTVGQNGEVSCETEILGHFSEHESMVYGCDVADSPSGQVKRIVSCSFYDKRICLWEWDASPDGQ